MTSNLNGFDITLPAIILEKMTQDWQVLCTTVYFEVLHGYKRFCCIRYTASTNSAYYRILYLCTQTNHVCVFITLNYTSIFHCVWIYYVSVAFYRDLTRKTVSAIKPEWIWHHSTRNSIRKSETGQTCTMHYDIFRSITRLQTVLLHSINCMLQFRILQYIIFVYTN